MVTLAVAITLLAIGIPAFQGIEANNRAAAQVNALVTGLTLARSEAAARGVPVTVCAAASATSCAMSSAWAGGWLVFTDADRNATPSSDEIVKVFDPPRGSPTIAANPAVVSVRFNSRGEQVSGNAVGFRLKQTNTTAQQDRCVRVAPSGQIATTRVTDADSCP
jgi:type IV fimbrial biogenesis protein FimT